MPLQSGKNRQDKATTQKAQEVGHFGLHQQWSSATWNWGPKHPTPPIAVPRSEFRSIMSRPTKKNKNKKSLKKPCQRHIGSLPFWFEFEASIGRPFWPFQTCPGDFCPIATKFKPKVKAELSIWKILPQKPVSHINNKTGRVFYLERTQKKEKKSRETMPKKTQSLSHGFEYVAVLRSSRPFSGVLRNTNLSSRFRATATKLGVSVTF